MVGQPNIMVSSSQHSLTEDLNTQWSSGVDWALFDHIKNTEVGSYFNQRSWLEHSLKHLVPDASDIWMLRWETSGGRILPVPFMLYKERLHGISCIVLRPLGDPMSDRFAPAVGIDEWPAMFQALSNAPFRWDVVIIGETTFTEDERLRLSSFAKGTGFATEYRLTGRTPQIDLTAMDLQNPFAGYRRKIRARLRRHRNSLEREGGVEYSFEDASSNTDEVFDRIAKIEEKSWKIEAGKAVFTNPKQRAFLRDVAADTRGTMRALASFAVIDGIDAAYLFSFVSEERILDYQGCYDEAFARHSIGLMITQALMEYGAANGISILDSSRSSINHVPIQAVFPHTMRDHHRMFLFNQSVSGRALNVGIRTVRPMIKSVAQKWRNLSEQTKDK